MSEMAEAIRQLISEKGYSEDSVRQTIERALKAAYKRTYGTDENAIVKFNDDMSDVSIYSRKVIIDGVYDPVKEIELEEARKLAGDSVEEGDEIVTCFRDGEVTLRKNRRTTGYTEATDQRCSDRTNKSMLSYGHIKNRTIIVDWLVKKDKRAIELENENTNVKPIPGSWNTVFNREVEQLFIILV